MFGDSRKPYYHTQHLHLFLMFFFQFFLTSTTFRCLKAQNMQSFPASLVTKHQDHQVKLVTVEETDGGAYDTWLDSNTTNPVLMHAKLSVGKLVLHPRGFVLPHFSDASMIAFVIQGSLRVGLVLPDANATEHVLTIKKGDIMPVYRGTVSWWYNPETTVDGGNVEMIFLAETSNTVTPAQFNEFYLAGTVGLLQGFSTDFITQSLGVDENQSEKLLKSQSGAIIVKLTEDQRPGEPPTETTTTSAIVTNNTKNIIMSYNLESAKPILKLNHAGSLWVVGPENFEFLKRYGQQFSAIIIKLEANSLIGPIASVDGIPKVFYLVEGSGRVQLSGVNGKNALNVTLVKGDLFVVPKFFTFALMDDEGGLHCLGLSTWSNGIYDVAMSGRKSLWQMLSPSVLQASFNVDIDIIKLIKSNLQDSIITPPKH